jgi:hypothetical protein
VTQVARLELANQPVELLENPQSLLGDLRSDDPAIAPLAAPPDEPVPFQTVEQSRDVGVGSGQSLANLPAGQPS